MLEFNPEKMDLEKALSSMPKRDQEIFKKRWFNNLTLREVGEIYNISRERVRQIESRALRKLRKFYILGGNLNANS